MPDMHKQRGREIISLTFTRCLALTETGLEDHIKFLLLHGCTVIQFWRLTFTDILIYQCLTVCCLILCNVMTVSHTQKGIVISNLLLSSTFNYQRNQNYSTLLSCCHNSRYISLDLQSKISSYMS